MNRICLLLVLLCAQGVFASDYVSPSRQTMFRRVHCGMTVSNWRNDTIFSAHPRIDLPTDAFNYTLGMQTFWVPLKASYFDKEKGSAQEITIIVALDKIGDQSKILDIDPSAVDLKTGDITLTGTELMVKDSFFYKTLPMGTDRWLYLTCGLSTSFSKP